MRTFVATPERLIVDELSATLGRPVAPERIGGYLGRSEVFALPDEGAVLKIYHDNAALKSRREVDTLEMLRHSELPVPTLLLQGHFSDGEPWVLMSLLPGFVLEAHEQEIAPSDTMELFGRMGGLLAAFHSVPIRWEAGHPAFSDPLGLPARRYAAYRAHVLARSDADHALYVEAAGRMIALESRIVPIREPVMVHRDFCRRNILVHRDERSAWEISGLIDFERSLPGDPMEDIALLAFKEFLGSVDVRDQVLRAYTAVRDLPNDADDRLAYHLYGLFFEIAKWASVDDPEYYHRSMRALARLLDGDPTLSARPAEAVASATGVSREGMRTEDRFESAG